MKEVSIQKFATILSHKKDIILLDVREDYEYELGHLSCTHIPMHFIPEKAKNLDCNKETYVLCQSGKRAAAVANYLETNFNFSDIYVVEGGIEAYINEIDQSILKK